MVQVSSSLGEFCPLDTERGYHVAFGPKSEGAISRAVTDPSYGWIATPMGGGLRVAGKVELGGAHQSHLHTRRPQLPVPFRALRAFRAPLEVLHCARVLQACTPRPPRRAGRRSSARRRR